MCAVLTSQIFSIFLCIALFFNQVAEDVQLLLQGSSVPHAVASVAINGQLSSLDDASAPELQTFAGTVVHAGSTDAILTQIWVGGAFTHPQLERQSFNAWGERRDPTTFVHYRTYDSQPYRTSGQDYDRGFTGHEHLDDSGLIHMNGRIYDPELGRMLSPDPFVQVPEFSQNFNRYSYVMDKAQHVVGHGIVGGAANEAMGGKFQDGFLAAAAGAYASWTVLKNSTITSTIGSTVEGSTAIAGVIGGTASAIGGGKFANGAWTASFQHLLNMQLTYSLNINDPDGPEIVGYWMGPPTDPFTEILVGGVGAGGAKISMFAARRSGSLFGRLIGGLKNRLGFGQAAPKTTAGTRGYRYVTEAEIQAIKDTGMLRGGRAGDTFFTKDLYKSGAHAQERLSLPSTPTHRVEFEILNNPTMLRNGMKVDPVGPLPGKGAEFMTRDPVRVDLLNVQPLR